MRSRGGNGTGFRHYNCFASLFSCGVNHTFVAASIPNLLVFFAVPTQLGQTLTEDEYFTKLIMLLYL